MIIKTPVTTNYFSAPNLIAQDNTLSDRAARIITYAASLPANWRIIPAQLMKHFGWGRDSTYKALRELCVRGYAVLKRGKQFAEWIIYTTPQTPESLKPTPDEACKNPDFKNSTNSDALQKTKHSQRTKETTTAIEPIQAIEKPDVVVIQGNVDQKGVAKPDTLEEPTPTKATDDTQQVIAGIESKHQLTARQALRSLTKEEADSVLCAFTLAMAKGSISNPIAYLITLVRATKNGTFSPVTGPQATPTMTAGERIAAEKRRAAEAAKRGKMDNQQYFEWLSKQYGDKAQTSKPASSTRISMLRSAMKTA